LSRQDTTDFIQKRSTDANFGLSAERSIIIIIIIIMSLRHKLTEFGNQISHISASKCDK